MTIKISVSIAYALVLCLWVGGTVLFTFLATPAIFSNFDRDMAGRIVGVMFPLYFPYVLALSALSLICVLLLRDSFAPWAFKASMALVVLALAINAYVTFVLHPQTRDIKARVHSFEQEPDSAARKRFRQLHAISAILNLTVIADGVTLVVIHTIAQR